MSANNRVATHEQGMMMAASDNNGEANIDELEKEYAQVVANLRAVFDSGVTKDKAWRVHQLKQLRRGVLEMKEDICEAMKADLGRSRYESIIAEMVAVVTEVDHLAANVESWMKPEKVSTPMTLQPSSSYIQSQPRGVVLVLSPWNYPINLALVALAGAICAGNAAIVKPSEVSAHCAKVIEKLVGTYLDTDAIKVIQGAVPETTALLRLRFDFIHMTGSGGIGRIVARAAAEHLTPISLELGGKSPTFVHESCSLQVTARRLIGGKLLNNAQTCIAPDYVVATRAVADKLIPELQKTLVKMYGEDPKQSNSYGRIINERHFDRIMRLADPAAHGGECIGQGLDKADRSAKYIPPTLIINPRLDSPLMQEEIFGPLLPIVVVEDLDEGIAIVNAREHPLALYVFSEDQKVIDYVLEHTTSGGSCVNDCLYHITNPNLPFGGVGTSGIGAYHGKHSFDEFSHRRAVMVRSTWIDPGFRYAPYSDEAAEKVLNFVASEGMSPAAKAALLAAGVGVVGLAIASRL